jgi:regulator of ribonuclease activity A
MTFTTADLYDAHGDKLQVVQPVFNDYGGRKKFYGQIVTVRVFEDNSLVRAALEEKVSGKVLVVDGGASMRCALVGDMLAQLGRDNGWAGIIISGCIRDSVVIAGLDIGIKALGTNPRKSVKKGVGERDVPVTFAGVTCTPGHYLYADQDGILISAVELS